VLEALTTTEAIEKMSRAKVPTTPLVCMDKVYRQTQEHLHFSGRTELGIGTQALLEPKPNCYTG
jgi:hypothetical protein